MIKHTKVSGLPSDGDATKIQGPDWDADHSIDDAAAVKTALGITSTDVSGLAAIATSGSGADLAAGSVTNAKLANMAGTTFKANVTGGSAAPTDASASAVKTALAITTGDVSGLATVASSGSASDLGSGTLPDARMPALTGDVTSSAGTVATTIANDAVSNAKLANVATATIKGRATAGTGDPEDLTATQAKGVLAITTSDVSGLATVATSGSASDLGSGTLSASRLPAFTGDVTTSAGSAATTIAAHIVTYAQQAQAAANTIVGNNTGSTADKTDLTVAQVLAMLGIKLGNFGDGSDNSGSAVVLDGTNTFTSFLSKSGSVYTATREFSVTDLTINNGVTFKPDGYPFHVSGTLTLNGTIDVSGGAGGNGGDGTGLGGAGGVAAWTGTRVLPGGTAGGVGGNTAAQGGNSTAAPRDFSTTTAAGGTTSGGVANAGGTGGTGHGGGGGGSGGTNGGAGNAGLKGGDVTLKAASSGDVHSVYHALRGKDDLAVVYTGATGGGGGGGAGSNGGSGGGGGAGGGWCAFEAFVIAGSGSINANGGNGGNGATSVNAGGGAGGGGGGGGLVAVRTTTAVATVQALITVDGGTHGTGGGGTTGFFGGANGGDGGAGIKLVF